MDIENDLDFIFGTPLSSILIVLKVCDVIDWKWIWVFTPLLINIIIVIIAHVIEWIGDNF